MKKRVAKLYYGLGVLALLVVSVATMFVVTTGHNGAQASNTPSMAERDSTGQMKVDSVSEAALEQELSATDDKSHSKSDASAEMTDAKASSVTKNPLANVLKSGKPVLADFGRGTCIPCKMMQPILERLQKEYAGKVEILILDIGEYPVFSKEYHLMVIPTQIFFDSSGKEVNRHLGFMPEDEIVAQLKAMGVER
ncbi:MAG: thioredoxin family protein [candidate division WOR-3 bacterium]|nr:MAG: thioredoxin family protein [candidate division WOR-3 bacterium]